MERIGFIGLGLMGRPMAHNLVRAGYPVVVHNRSQASVEELVGSGAHAANSPMAVASQSDVVITMLPDPPAVEQVIAGKGGIFEGGHSGLLVIDMSSSSPTLAHTLAEYAHAHDMEILDAPVSGGPIGAENATLSIMVGGSGAAFERALLIFSVLGKNIVHVGDVGAGQITKAANQVIIALTLAAVSEGLLLASSAGVDPEVARRAMLGGFASSRVLEYHGARMTARNFGTGSRVRSHYKDLRIALEIAEQKSIRLPLTQWVTERFGDLMQAGFADQDHSALFYVMEQIVQRQASELSAIPRSDCEI